MRGCARSRFVSLAERWRGGGGGRSEPRGATRGPASELHPLSRPLNPRAARLVRVCRVRFSVRSVRSPPRREKASRLSLPYPALPSRSLRRIPLRDRVNAYTVRFAHLFLFCPRKQPTDRLFVRPSVRWCFVRGESTGGFRDSARKLRDYPLGFSVDSLLRWDRTLQRWPRRRRESLLHGKYLELFHADR